MLPSLQGPLLEEVSPCMLPANDEYGRWRCTSTAQVARPAATTAAADVIAKVIVSGAAA